MTASATISLILSILSFFGIGALLTDFMRERTAKAKARIKAEKQQEMREVVEPLVKPIEERLDRQEKEMRLNSDATIAMLRHKMHDNYDKYKTRGYITETERANGNELYNAYIALGGNHRKVYVDVGKEGINNLEVK